VDETRRATAGPDRNIVALDQSGPKPSTDSVEQDPAARDPAAYDEHVPTFTSQRVEIVLPSVKNGRGRCAKGGARLGRDSTVSSQRRSPFPSSLSERLYVAAQAAKAVTGAPLRFR